jgi:hypothetical protein
MESANQQSEAAAGASESVRTVPLTPAERMQRTRRRRTKGLLLVSVEVRKSEIDVLVRRNFLAEADRENKAEIRVALHRFFDAALR